ncbi:MAG: DNA methyltransferase [Candidatus Hodarchaeota archaeon]
MQIKQPLTKEILKSIKSRPGFPIGTLDDILELSLTPTYTPCPNPFLDSFFSSNTLGPYNISAFDSDVVEGKFDPLYNIHTYHTKVPPRAIMRYILHYTKPGDVIFDGFCGTGMTGLATQLCIHPPKLLKEQIDKEMSNIQWGFRRVILCDLSPSATFIAANYNSPVAPKRFLEAVNSILAETKCEISWMFQTHDSDPSSSFLYSIKYVVWSDIFSCANCNHELVYWNEAINPKTRQKKKTKDVECPSCASRKTWNNLKRVYESTYDPILDIYRQKCKEIPVLIVYHSPKNGLCEKIPDELDFMRLEKIKTIPFLYWYPTNRIPEGINTTQPRKSHNITHTHHFYSERSLHFLSRVWHKAKTFPQPLKNRLLFWIQSLSLGLTYLNRFFVQSFSQVNRYLKGTLYVASVRSEINPFAPFQNKAQKIAQVEKLINYVPQSCIISTQSSTDLWQIPRNSIDYIFIDPPFGGNINYSELNFLWESWLNVFTNSRLEAIENRVQQKGIKEYKELMEQCFTEFFRILKPKRWMTLVFHNSKKKIWLALQEAILTAGFVISDVRILDKKQATMKQLTTLNAVAKDLIISAYKPMYEGSSDSTPNLKKVNVEIIWDFVREHLRRLSLPKYSKFSTKKINERQARILFDRVIAYLIKINYAVPISSPEFYEELNKRFVEHNELYFLPEQLDS